MAKKAPANPGRAGKKKRKPAPAASKHDGTNKTAGLTPMQAAFVQHYIIEKNAAEAARKAGYSLKSAENLGWQLLQIPTVRAAIDKKFQMQNERLDIRADRILLEIFRCATVDLADAYDDNGNLKNIKDIPEDIRRAIAGIETYFENTGTKDEPEITTVKKLKLVDKKGCMELMAKHFKLLTESLEIKGKVTLEQLVAAAGQPNESDA